MECAHEIREDIEKWHQDLPKFIRDIKPVLLLRIFRRQATYLRLAYLHAKILAYRVVLTGPYPKEPGEAQRMADRDIKTALWSCRDVLILVIAITREPEPIMFRTLWYAHYVAYVAAATLCVLPRIREQQKTYGGPRYRGHAALDSILSEFIVKAQKMLATETDVYSPARRWAVIIEEMRREMGRQFGDKKVEGNYAALEEVDLTETTGGAENGGGNNNGQGRNEDQRAQSQGQGGEEGNNEGQNQEEEGEEEEREEEEEEEEEEEDHTSPNDQLLEDALRAHWEADLRTDGQGQQSATPQESRSRGEGQTSEESGSVEPPNRLWNKWTPRDWVDLDSAVSWMTEPLELLHQPCASD